MAVAVTRMMASRLSSMVGSSMVSTRTSPGLWNMRAFIKRIRPLTRVWPCQSRNGRDSAGGKFREFARRGFRPTGRRCRFRRFSDAMTDHGYLALVLHAHLPFVRHPEYPEFLEEDWLYEAITETYLPLLGVFDRLAGDKVPFALTLTMTPPLCAMLRDPLLGERYLRYLDRSLVLAEKETVRVRGLGPGGGHGALLPRTPARLPPPVSRTLEGRPGRGVPGVPGRGLSGNHHLRGDPRTAAAHGKHPAGGPGADLHRAGRLPGVFRTRPGGHLAAGMRVRRRDRPGVAGGEPALVHPRRARADVRPAPAAPGDLRAVFHPGGTGGVLARPGIEPAGLERAARLSRATRRTGISTGTSASSFRRRNWSR